MGPEDKASGMQLGVSKDDPILLWRESEAPFMTLLINLGPKTAAKLSLSLAKRRLSRYQEAR